MLCHINSYYRGVKMFAFITRAVFGLEVTEIKNKVRISGIRADLMIEDINKSFGTSRVTVHMLNVATRSYVEFYSFFLIDFEYIIRKLSKLNNTKLGKRGYVKMHAELLKNTWLSRLDKQYPSIFDKTKLNEIKFNLLDHQATFIDYYDTVISRYALRGILMAATPGSGKTISAIAVGCAYNSENVIVISPKNAVFRVWEKTLLEDMNVPQTVWVHASKKPQPPPDKNRWYIFHYESLGEAVELANKLSKSRCTIILDESHNLNEIKSLRTERFVSMCRMMTNSIIVELSGTPMKAMGAEAIPLISAIDPLFTDRCMEKFKKIYGREAKAATEILANRLGIIMYKVNKEESKISEPVEHQLLVKVKNSNRFTLDTIKRDMTDFIIKRTEYYAANKKSYEKRYYDALREFELTTLPKLSNPEKYKLYRDYIANFVKNGYVPFISTPQAMYCNDYEKRVIQPALSQKSRKDFKLSKSVVKYVDLKIKGECLGTVLSRARTECNKAVLESLDLASLIDGAEKKTLVFTSYVEVVKATSLKLEAQGYKPLSVYADTNHNLPQMVRQFGEDESINPLIATYQSLSTAVPLIMANRVILLNAPFRIHEKEQTVARANRLGQDRTVDVYNVLLDTGSEPNISTRSADIMEWSREQVNAIMGFDNSDNAISLESLLDDIDDEIEDIVQPSLESITPQPVETEVQEMCSLESLSNAINSSTDFVITVTNAIARGNVPSTNALAMYRIINPSLEAPSLESNHTQLYACMISLEQEKSRTRTILKRIIDLVIKFIKAVITFVKDSGRKLRTNMDLIKELSTRINKSSTKLFAGDDLVNVNGAMWLTDVNGVSPENCVTMWNNLSKTTTHMNSTYAAELKRFVKDLEERLNDVVNTPGLNQSKDIYSTVSKLGSMIPSKTVKEYDGIVVMSSPTLVAGREFIFTKLSRADEVSIIKQYSVINFKRTVSPNFDVKEEQKVKSLTQSNATDIMSVAYNTNKEGLRLSNELANVSNKVDSFLTKAKNSTDKIGEMSPAQEAIVNAQVTLMVSSVKSLVAIMKEQTTLIDRASKYTIKYIVASAQGR